ncbi:hypothetical protein C8R47DRAFT_1066444 [Mycena vitilis]|nr:hypothetical protein C8R47DRAFT_1066444 [Mycena vitilis]
MRVRLEPNYGAACAADGGEGQKNASFHAAPMRCAGAVECGTNAELLSFLPPCADSHRRYSLNNPLGYISRQAGHCSGSWHFILRGRAKSGKVGDRKKSVAMILMKHFISVRLHAAIRRIAVPREAFRRCPFSKFFGRRQARGGSTFNSPCASVQLDLQLVAEAPRSGADFEIRFLGFPRAGFSYWHTPAPKRNAPYPTAAFVRCCWECAAERRRRNLFFGCTVLAAGRHAAPAPSIRHVRLFNSLRSRRAAAPESSPGVVVQDKIRIFRGREVELSWVSKRGNGRFFAPRARQASCNASRRKMKGDFVASPNILRSVHEEKTIKQDEKGDGRRLGDGRLRQG